MPIKRQAKTGLLTVDISRRVFMYLYGIKLGEVYILRTSDSEKFESMLESLEPIKSALTIIKPNWDYGENE